MEREKFDREQVVDGPGFVDEGEVFLAAGIPAPVSQEQDSLAYGYDDLEDEEPDRDISELTRGLVIIAGVGTVALLGFRRLIRSRKENPEQV